MWLLDIWKKMTLDTYLYILYMPWYMCGGDFKEQVHPKMEKCSHCFLTPCLRSLIVKKKKNKHCTFTFILNNWSRWGPLLKCLKNKKQTPRNPKSPGIMDHTRQAVWTHFMCVPYESKHPHLLQLFRRMPQHCFAVLLQECFVAYKTSPDLGWVGNARVFIFLGRT